MSLLLAIDPGVCTGWALFQTGDLLDRLEDFGAFEGIQSFCTRILSQRADEAVIEIPRVYPGRKQKGRPNDLITLAISCGRILEVLTSAGTPPHQFYPHQWKGSVPKKIHHQRIREALDPTTRMKVDHSCRMLGSKAHNMLDAIGLGIWFLNERRTRAEKEKD